MTINIACLQVDVRWGQEELNVDRVLNAIDDLEQGSVNIACLPELFTTGYDYEYLKRRDHNITRGILQRLSDKAKEKAIFIIAGSLPHKEEDKIYNTLFIIDPDGVCIASYRKLHLFPLMGEDSFFTPGSKILVFDTIWSKMGVAICYDLRFSWLFQSMAFAGAHVIFVPAQFPAVRIEHWDILLRARAIENQLFMVGINRIGRDASGIFSGHTSIYSPTGRLVAGGEGMTGDGWITGEIDLSEVEKTRKELPTMFGCQ